MNRRRESMLRYATLPALCLALGCASETPRAERLSESGVARASIQGGTDDTTDSQVVVLFNEQIKEYCSGTLIAPNLVLTAAHCVANEALVSGFSCANFTYPGTAVPAAVLVSQEPTAPQYTTQYLRASELIPLPMVGESECDRDLALVILKNDVDPATSHLAEPRFAPVAVDEGYSIVGYGETTSGVGIGTRRRLDGLAVACAGDCKNVAMGATEWLGHPALAHTGGRPGDSGSPALDAEGRIIGVFVKHDEYPAMSTVPDDLIYSSLPSHASWLQEGAAHAADLGGYALPIWAGGSVGGAGGAGGGSGGGGGVGPTPPAAPAADGCAVASSPSFGRAMPLSWVVGGLFLLALRRRKRS